MEIFDKLDLLNLLDHGCYVCYTLIASPIVDWMFGTCIAICCYRAFLTR